MMFSSLKGFVIDSKAPVEKNKLATHLLRLVKNDNRTVSADDVNRTAGGKFVSLGIDDSRFLAFAVLFQGGSERLRVNNHHIDTGAGGKVVELIEIGAVVNKETRLFAVVLHKMVYGHFKGLLHALADGDGWHNDDKLAPAIPLV